MSEKRYSWLTVMRVHCWEFRDHEEAFRFLADGDARPVRDLGSRYRIVFGKQFYTRYSTGDGFRIACIVTMRHYIHLPKPMTRDEIIEWIRQFGSPDDMDALAETLILMKRVINRLSRETRAREKQRLYGHLLGKEVFDGYKIVNVYQHGSTCVVTIKGGSTITLRLRKTQCRDLTIDYLKRIVVGE